MAKHRKPAAQHKFEGTDRADRAEPTGDLPLITDLEPTYELDANGLAEWDRVVPPLSSFGMLLTSDAFQLTNMCTSASLCCSLTVLVRELIAARDLSVEFSRAVTAMNRALTHHNKLAESFGLSPRVRSTIGVDALKSQRGRATQDAIDQQARDIGI